MAFVIGTAGHVDHGKSALIQALTGIDPDRLREEKDRGMTIDLGFAWLKLPGGREVSIVDVPGHERFIKNMLAGVGGIDVAMLVIAADEGVMPQTREHLAILDLLRVENGVVAITKKDLVDDEWLEMVHLDVDELLHNTTLEKAPVIAVSAITGEGLPGLLSAIDALLDAVEPRRDIGRPRLPIDRVFTMSGFGTVVTGTLIDGSLSVGQEVVIVPSSRKAHIRGLQTHKQKVEVARPGSRVAANLSGVAVDDLERGDVVTSRGWLVPTSAVDVSLRLLPSAPHPLSHGTTVAFHTGSAEAQAKLRLLDAEKLEPGQSAFAQLVLDHPVAAVKDDMFIIRSTKDTLGGGRIIDPVAKRHRRFHAATIDSLKAREKGSGEDVILATLSTKGNVEMERLATSVNMPLAEVERAVAALLGRGEIVALGGKKRLLFSAANWLSLAGEAAATVAGYHKRNPLRPGMPREELRDRLRVPQAYFDSALERLVSENVLAADGQAVALPGFQVRLTAAQQNSIDIYLKELSGNPYSPAPVSSPDTDLLNLLIGQRRVVKITDDIVFAAPAYDEMVKAIVEHIESSGKITVAEVRDMFHTSRKFALALMEHLDEQKITRRVGDERVLR